MSIYRLEIEFASPICANSFNSIDAPISIGADRLFSCICIGWNTLFSATDLSENIIEPFLTNRKPWVHSDLLPSDTESIFLSASKWAKGGEKANSTIRLALEDLHIKDEEITWLQNRNAADGSAGFQTAWESNLKLPISTIMLSRIHRAERETEKSSMAPFRKSIHPAAIADRAAESEKPSRLCLSSLFQLQPETQSPDLLQKLIATFNFLKDEGMGGMRSIGAGAIHKITFQKLNLSGSEDGSSEPQPGQKIESATWRSENSLDESESAPAGSAGVTPALKESSKYLLLSTCCPDENMINAIQSSKRGANSYQLQQSSGWIYDSEGRATNIKKPYTFAFTAGSTFAEKPTGKLLDLSTDNHPCYRYGIPFSVRV